MKRPNFFIIGALKCGTTSMAAWLREHPQIFMSNPKELHFFCTDSHLPEGISVRTLEKYLRIFQNAGDKHLAVGEASPSYLHSHVAVKNILEFNPAARFIVMLRNPVDMAASWHGQLLDIDRRFFLANNKINKPSSWYGQIFWGSNRRVLDDFEADWKARYATDLEPDKLDFHNWDPDLLQYDKICKSGEHVQRLLQTVDVKSVLFIVMDDLISDPLREYRRVLEFLDVPYDGKNRFSVHNPARRPRNKLIQSMSVLLADIKRLSGIGRSFGLLNIIAKTNTKPQKTQLRPEFKQELIDVFREDVTLLSSLLGRDFSHWLR